MEVLTQWLWCKIQNIQTLWHIQLWEKEKKWQHINRLSDVIAKKPMNIYS